MPRQDELTGRVVLVTGASGFLGSRTVAALAGRGCAVHALIRETSRTEHLNLPGVTIFRGNVASTESLQAAFTGVSDIVHAAADTRGEKLAGELSTILGTKNILALAQQHRIRKLVYISSCSVYGTAGCRRGQTLTEESPLEPFPQRRGAYSYAKFMAERLVVRAMESGTAPIVCLRPGTIYGPGGAVYSPMLGLTLGSRFFAVIGGGDFILPLVYVDNLVDAILVALSHPRSDNEIYNVVDPERVTKKAYMEGLVAKIYPGCRTMYLPLRLMKTLVRVQEGMFRMLGRQPLLTLYRLVSSQNQVVVEAEKIRRDLAWHPPVPVAAAFEHLIRQARGQA